MVCKGCVGMQSAKTPAGALPGGEQQMDWRRKWSSASPIFRAPSRSAEIIAMHISHRAYVDHSRMVFEGTPSQLCAHPSIRQTWLEV